MHVCIFPAHQNFLHNAPYTTGWGSDFQSLISTWSIHHGVGASASPAVLLWIPQYGMLSLPLKEQSTQALLDNLTLTVQSVQMRRWIFSALQNPFEHTYFHPQYGNPWSHHLWKKSVWTGGLRLAIHYEIWLYNLFKNSFRFTKNVIWGLNSTVGLICIISNRLLYYLVVGSFKEDLDQDIILPSLYPAQVYQKENSLDVIWAVY